MQTWLRIRILIIAVIGVSIASFFWFLLNSTAYFQRGMDLIGTAYLWGAGVPVLLFATGLTVLLVKKWTPDRPSNYVGICVALVLTTLISAALIRSVGTHGWANEKVWSDTIKISSDGKYEYRLDLVNLFQRNSYARLYLKHVTTGEENYIPTEIHTNTIKALAVGGDDHWIRLEPTDRESYYILYTTEELRIPEERFEIDISLKKIRRLD